MPIERDSRRIEHTDDDHTNREHIVMYGWCKTSTVVGRRACLQLLVTQLSIGEATRCSVAWKEKISCCCLRRRAMVAFHPGTNCGRQDNAIAIGYSLISLSIMQYMRYEKPVIFIEQYISSVSSRARGMEMSVEPLYCICVYVCGRTSGTMLIAIYPIYPIYIPFIYPIYTL